MDALLILVRLFLAIIFTIAALAKLSKRAESVGTIEEFGVPRRYAELLANGLPAAELGIAILLLPAVSARTGAFLALVLLLAFSVAIAVNLRRGKRPKCNCFGQLNAKPIGPQTLLRNLLLVCSAGLVAASNSGGSLSRLMNGIDARLAMDSVLLLLISALLWMIVQLFRQQGRLLGRIDVLELRLDEALGPLQSAQAPGVAPGLPKGAAAPAFELESLVGQHITLRQLLSSSPPLLALLFVDPGCAPCSALVPQIGLWQRQHADSVPIIVITRGAKQDNLEKYSELGAQNVLIQLDNEVSQSYQVSATPAAVLLSSEGEVVAQTALGSKAILELLASTAATLDASQRTVMTSLLAIEK